MFILLFTFIQFLLCGQPGQQSPQFFKFVFFLLIIIKSGRLAGIRWSMWISTSQRCLVLYSYTPPGRVLSYTLFVVTCCIRLLCNWWFRLYHNITNFAIFLRRMYYRFEMIGSCGALFSAIRRYSIFLLKFPFLNHVLVFSFEIPLYSCSKRH